MVDGPISPSVTAEPIASAATEDAFRDALDRLSRKVDEGNFERMRWARDEAPKLVRLVELVKGAVADRGLREALVCRTALGTCVNLSG